MRQRVGFARALAVEPDALLMDEPFSALDVLTAENLRSELVQAVGRTGVPTKAVLIVTHNIEEAVQLADRIMVLSSNPGRIKAELPVPCPGRGTGAGRVRAARRHGLRNLDRAGGGGRTRRRPPARAARRPPRSSCRCP